MKYIFKASILTFLLIISSCGNYKNKKNSEIKNQSEYEYSAKIDSLIQTTKPRKFNGVISITKNSKVIYSKAYGYSDFEKKTPISLNDNFRIQSNSKQITAVLILKEVEKGNINLTTSVGEYLPELKQSWAKKVTIHHLLNMSSGIVDLKKPLAFEPGTNFHYSNPAYGLLGKVIEAVTGETYSKVANTLFKKLEMHNTFCYEINKMNTNLINGHWIFDDKIETVDFDSLNFTEESWANFLPAGGIVSNLKDLHIWDSKLHNNDILKTESYNRMINSKIIDMDYIFSDKKSKYGYGLNINEEKPYKYIGHAGRGFGFVNLKIYVPEKKLDIIILENVYMRNVDPTIVYHYEKEIREIILNSNIVE